MWIRGLPGIAPEVLSRRGDGKVILELTQQVICKVSRCDFIGSVTDLNLFLAARRYSNSAKIDVGISGRKGGRKKMRKREREDFGDLKGLVMKMDSIIG